MRRAVVVAGLLAGLSACAGGPDAAKFAASPPMWAQSDAVAYKCAGNKTFYANFSTTGEEAAVKLGGKLYPLTRERSGSGIRYSSDDVEYSAKGRDAAISRSPQGEYRNCKVVD